MERKYRHKKQAKAEANPTMSSLPGLYHTEGDRVLTALVKLYLKIQHVERAYADAQAELIARKSDKSEKELQEALEIAKSRCQLLEQQLYRARQLLAQNVQSDEPTRLAKDAIDAGCPIVGASKPETDSNSGRTRSSKKHSSMDKATVEIKSTKSSHSDGTEQSENIPRSTTGSQTNSNFQMHPRRIHSVDDIPHSVQTKPKSAFNDHYHLQLSDIPFVLGKATSASHSVIANLQGFIAMLKQHNPRICSSVGSHNFRMVKDPPSLRRTMAKNLSRATMPVITELKDVLQGLEIERDILSDDVNRLKRQIQHSSPSKTEQLRRDLKALAIRLSVKEEQINRLQTIQALLEDDQSSPVHSSEEMRHNKHQTRGADGTMRTHRHQKALLNELRYLQATLKKEQLQWK